ncbi:TPA: RNA methyltransferase [Candidatus Daviesbacteria bacterium]|uniref:tRNA/rRNA methyltransferase n=1 Tax=Candidatus Daviesbacteria bacterium GW2011_GWC2_40_12 TaxID=1618431 RepID=A0A0G0T2E7_9BACT|nr:MAG: tRNA/rRNA methyltransferase [Candidatus Daviesbacteria bacterium GW2011_GWF2_38_7]KKR15587.1 MAG: tRNA/rRNA methyltransferase [Candidatus Daviesbacteria bacterium GW2011_GWA2_39_33]KKR41265.1 MAG: tRNA/rRNA methyltransferase [Candidatus Daviesbacteria bacterium GW2011_GWC2_40_12]HCE31278.1 RNA methyltransferase [Candidatus Daviesbacteria bacterium]
MKLNAKQLRSYSPLAVSGSQQTANSQKPARNATASVAGGPIARNDIYIVLDNVLDTYNIGSIFRLADAVAAKKVFLCGGTETPPNHRIKKASINTTEWVEWEYAETALQAVRNLQFTIYNLQIIAIEQSTKSVPYDEFNYTTPVCLIVGNETTGVSKEVLKMADAVVEIPMFGVNISLNVMVSLGVVLYKVVERMPKVLSEVEG